MRGTAGRNVSAQRPSHLRSSPPCRPSPARAATQVAGPRRRGRCSIQCKPTGRNCQDVSSVITTYPKLARPLRVLDAVNPGIHLPHAEFVVRPIPVADRFLSRTLIAPFYLLHHMVHVCRCSRHSILPHTAENGRRLGGKHRFLLRVWEMLFDFRVESSEALTRIALGPTQPSHDLDALQARVPSVLDHAFNGLVYGAAYIIQGGASLRR